MVKEAYRARAAGLFQLTGSIISVSGPPLATVLFFASGVQWALIIDALSFMISFLCLLMIRLPYTSREVEQTQEQESFFQQLREGIQFYLTNTVLMTLLITGILVICWWSAFQVLGVFFVSQNLHAPTSFYGYLGTAAGIGVAAGAIFGSAFASRLGVTRLFWLSLMATGILVMVYARLTSWLPALVVVFLISFFMILTNVTVEPIALHVTPRNLLGRTSSLLNPTMTLASILSALLAGWLSSSVLHNFHAVILGISFGPIDTIFLLAGCLALGGGFYAMVNVRGVQLAKEGDGNENSKGDV